MSEYPEWYKPAAQVQAEKLEQQKQKLRSEAHRRIIEKWPEYAQLNAIRGVYGETAQQEMESWVDHHRTRYNELLERTDLIDFNPTNDELWKQ